MAYPGQFAVVSDYITYSRVILQDQVQPYRYPDDDLVQGLNLAWGEFRRLRPDAFINSSISPNITSVPSFTANDSTVVTLSNQYQMAFIYYICGQASMKDEEYTQDARAVAFLKMFHDILVGPA